MMRFIARGKRIECSERKSKRGDSEISLSLDGADGIPDGAFIFAHFADVKGRRKSYRMRKSDGKTTQYTLDGAETIAPDASSIYFSAQVPGATVWQSEPVPVAPAALSIPVSGPMMLSSAAEEDPIDCELPPVTVHGRVMTIPGDTVEIAVAGDRNAVTVTFICDRCWDGQDMQTKVWFVEILNANGEYDIVAPVDVTMQEDTVTAVWLVNARHAYYDGKVQVRLRATDGTDFVWQTHTGEFTVYKTFEQSEPAPDPGLSYIDNAIQEIEEIARRAENATENPPKINSSTQTWLVWDKDSGGYVDSGISTVGPIGPIGPQGEPGTGLLIKGVYPTLADLQDAHPSGIEGDAYAVGDESGSEIYIWNATLGAWQSIGGFGGIEYPINGILPGSGGYTILAADIPTSDSSNVQDEIDRLDAVDRGLNSALSSANAAISAANTAIAARAVKPSTIQSNRLYMSDANGDLLDSGLSPSGVATLGNDGKIIPTQIVTSGTWTPVLVGSTVAGSNTYSIQTGRYAVIGNVVFITCSIRITHIGNTMAGNVKITGLPFSSVSNALAFSVSRYSGIALYTGYSTLGIDISSGTEMFLGQSGSGRAYGTIDRNALTPNVDLFFEFFYMKA